MTTDEKLSLGAIILVLALMGLLLWWWLPQKRQACQKLYDNRPAQIVCLLSSN
jgi:NhaP-type Na+/H+ or K+/H+ antiporter